MTNRYRKKLIEVALPLEAINKACARENPTLIAAKMTAVAGAWLVSFIPVISALTLWVVFGGHLDSFETLNLLFGHLLYGLLIAAIALLAASIAESSATAAIITLALTIGSWVLDFSLGGQPGLLEWISRLSLTQTLRPFEQGLFSVGLVIGNLAAIGACVANSEPAPAATTHRSDGVSFLRFILCRKTRATSICAATFCPSSSARLRTSPFGWQPRAMTVVSGMSDESYGEIEYAYGGHSDKSRSTSHREVLPLLYGLAGIPAPEAAASDGYPGYPLVANAQAALPWFFGALPLTRP